MNRFFLFNQKTKNTRVSCGILLLTLLVFTGCANRQSSQPHNNTSKLSSNKYATLKVGKFKEKDKLKKRQPNDQESNRKANEIFIRLEREQQGNSILNSISAYEQAKSEGYNPQRFPGIHPNAVILLGGVGDFNIKINFNSDSLLKAVPMELSKGREYIKNYDKEGVMIIKLSPGRIKREVTKRFKVPSKYIATYLVEPNPEYNAAQLDYQSALAEYNMISAKNRSSSVGSDVLASAILGGINGLQIGLAADRLNQARIKLSSTPPTIKIPQYKEYKYDCMTLSVKKYLSIYIYYIRNKNVQLWSGMLYKEKIFNIPYNKRKTDSGDESRSYYTENDVNMYENGDLIIESKDLAKLIANKPKYFKANDSLSFLNNSNTVGYKSIGKKSNKSNKNKHAKTKIEKLMDSVVAIQDGGNNTIGTGFFVGKNIIITNRHVVDGKNLITIQTISGKKLVGSIIDVNYDIDLALIKVNYSGKPVTFYTGKVSPGTDVLAIGNPMGLNYSLTKGIVSNVRLRRDVNIPYSKQHLFIQTDVAINPGNSGGPLFLNGKVVGINTLKLVAKDIEGIGFAIHYKEILKYLKETKNIMHK